MQSGQFVSLFLHQGDSLKRFETETPSGRRRMSPAPPRAQAGVCVPGSPRGPPAPTCKCRPAPTKRQDGRCCSCPQRSSLAGAAFAAEGHGHRACPGGRPGVSKGARRKTGASRVLGL